MTQYAQPYWRLFTMCTFNTILSFRSMSCKLPYDHARSKPHVHLRHAFVNVCRFTRSRTYVNMKKVRSHHIEKPWTRCIAMIQYWVMVSPLHTDPANIIYIWCVFLVLCCSTIPHFIFLRLFFFTFPSHFFHIFFHLKYLRRVGVLLKMCLANALFSWLASRYYK